MPHILCLRKDLDNLQPSQECEDRLHGLIRVYLLPLQYFRTKCPLLLQLPKNSNLLTEKISIKTAFTLKLLRHKTVS